MRAKRIGPGVLILLGLPAIGSAQPFTKADSGWVPLFNGKDFEGIYGRLYKQAVTPVPDSSWVILYPGTDTATIRGSNTTRQGNIGTKKNFSHYRMRVEYRHDLAREDLNAGITYHTDESKERMDGNWPFSIECQMQQREPGSAYSIAGLAFDTRVNGNIYAPTGGTPVTACVGTGCNSRQYYSNPSIKGGTHWQEMEIIVRGSDTAWHLVKDQVVFKLWNMRVKTSNGFGEKVTSGGIGLQAEAALINYRRWEIMELPTTGPNFLVRIILSNTNGGTRIAPGNTHTIAWRTLGDVPKVNILYHTGTGSWQTAASDVANTGTYAWTAPSVPTNKLRVAVSGTSATPWVLADTSNADNEITGGVGVPKNLEASFDPVYLRSEFEATKGRDLNGRVQGRHSGKAFRVIYHRP